MVSTPQRQITDTEKLMALRKDYADLEQRFNILSMKFSTLVEEIAALEKRLEPFEEINKKLDAIIKLVTKPEIIGPR